MAGAISVTREDIRRPFLVQSSVFFKNYIRVCKFFSEWGSKMSVYINISVVTTKQIRGQMKLSHKYNAGVIVG
jgi:hypothetical protein